MRTLFASLMYADPDGGRDGEDGPPGPRGPPGPAGNLIALQGPKGDAGPCGGTGPRGSRGGPREGTVPGVRRERRGRLAAEGWVLLVPSVGGDRWVTLAHRTTGSDWPRGTQGWSRGQGHDESSGPQGSRRIPYHPGPLPVAGHNHIIHARSQGSKRSGRHQGSQGRPGASGRQWGCRHLWYKGTRRRHW